jgi:murein DD-endopeptidase MepM/ murein hydrolase activator NlpD
MSIFAFLDVRPRTLLPRRSRLLLAALCLLPLTLGIALGNAMGSNQTRLAQRIEQLQGHLDSQRDQIAVSEAEAHRLLQAMTLKLAELQARALRLDAVGERIIELVGLDRDEFGFDRPLPVGGPADEAETVVPPAEITRLFGDISAQFDEREHQLLLLNGLIEDRNLDRESSVAGRPVASGWVSSDYGYRVDPFNGRRAWHGGVDFAGAEGSRVVAVAAGIVTGAGSERGYGNMVEIDHGDGLVTRYGHNRENRVAVGDLVKKGEVIALMGKTGRASGPHVHFEVTRDGQSMNPAPYIHRVIQ